ncbi:MAG TPA: serine/threonine protein kinase [Burkholderiales bacterium]|nr:serine/threonine protein kinase [Burkholderiales bacterium]
MSNPGGDAAAPYAGLTPDLILNALDSAGLRTDGRLLALNSYENRVYQAGVEDGPPVVAKFYRPGRWSDAQILEEHAFTVELAQREIPVVAPLVFGARTLHRFADFRFAVYPRRGGRAPELDDPDTLEWLGRFIGRIHAVGATRPFEHRPRLDIATFGEAPRDLLLANDWVPGDLREAYASITAQALDGVRGCFERTGGPRGIRLHGDCHPGNVLWTGDGPHFVDFDDARTGPAAQDLWMLLSGDRGAMTRQLSDVLAGYEDFADFDRRETALIEALRTLRLMHYAAWLASRWHDPAFPAAFPWFHTTKYWQDHILQLREQVAAMQEPPLGPL